MRRALLSARVLSFSSARSKLASSCSLHRLHRLGTKACQTHHEGSPACLCVASFGRPVTAIYAQPLCTTPSDARCGWWSCKTSP